MRILSILFFFASLNAFGATCTTTTRTNYSSGQTLTSTALNADFNQLVTKANAFDGGCVTDGTLEASALNSTDFAAVTNGIHQGCALAYSDANTISIGKCILSINGNMVKTTAANTVTWGCAGCDAEASGSQYYVYAKTGSSGTILNLVLLTTAPGVDGYDLSGNKVLGSVFNNSASDLDQKTLKAWTTSKLVEQGLDVFSFGYGATVNTVCSVNGECGYLNQTGSHVSSLEKTNTGTYKINFRRTYIRVDCFAQGVDGSGNAFIGVPATAIAANNATFLTYVISPFALGNSVGAVHCVGVY